MQQSSQVHRSNFKAGVERGFIASISHYEYIGSGIIEFAVSALHLVGSPLLVALGGSL